MSPVEILGFLGGGIGMFLGLPQARHVRAVGHGEGVSLATWTLMFIVMVSWTSYGWRIEAPSVYLTNMVAATINGSVVLALLGRPRITVPALLAGAAGLIAMVQVLPEAVVTTVLVALMFGQVPQIIASYRNMRERRHSAVSMTTLQVGLASLACWEAYAFLTQTHLMMITTSLGLVMNLSVMGMETIARRPQPASVV